ncbi:MAG TPA: hypothetical protein VND41_00040 [Nitrososphaerales archaeon]|nr:hypothetical protein [Nitrososphaerales archaeon]
MKRKEGAFWVAQALIVAGVLAIVALPSSSVPVSQVSSSSTTQPTGPLMFTSPVSPQGLQLKVSLNSTTMQSHGAISGQVEVVNTLNQNVTLSGLVQNQNVSEWGFSYVPCGTSLFMGFGVFNGRVTAANLSTAGLPVELIPPLEMACPFPIGYTSATFLPDGSQVIAWFGSGEPPPGHPVTQAQLDVTTYYSTKGYSGCCQTKGLLGYWNDSITNKGDLSLASPAFVYFTPGEYTIVAADDWDQYVYVSFVVQSPGAYSSSSTSNIAGANAVVATITVTTTLTTQASQATTTYAIPTTSCTLMGPIVTTTTTITVGPNPPASTTTTTVTTTSTSYTQTVTVTSCTESEPTVTSTVTTTVDP